MTHPGSCNWFSRLDPKAGREVSERREAATSKEIEAASSNAWRDDLRYAADMSDSDDVTRLLVAAARGDPNAAERLLPLVYDELRKLAAQRMSIEQPGQTLQATALVHEAYLRL